MPFVIQVKDGQVLCLCCRDRLWHCKSCWLKYHNSVDGEDYIPPKYYGQPMNEDVDKSFEKLTGVTLKKSIIADKNRLYKEGEYH